MSKDKKRLFLIAAIVILVITFIFVAIRNNKKDSLDQLSLQGPEPIKTYSLPESKINLENIPDGTEKLEVGDIQVDNFLEEAVEASDKKSYVIAERENYHLLYIPESSLFLISIFGSPFSSIRADAENDLLKTLNVSQEEACNMNVVITTPLWANPNEAGPNYKLSFCK